MRPALPDESAQDYDPERGGQKRGERDLSVGNLGAEDLGAENIGAENIGAPRSLFESSSAVFALSLFIGLALNWTNAQAVWRTNRFFDTDDAMHLVQARDWMAGQGWFDMVEKRLDPPSGTLMHWRRVIDIPIAAFTQTFGLFVSSDIAEKLMRIAYPATLQMLLFATMIWTAKKLVSFRGVAAASLLTAFSLSVLVQFPPGRINHHNVQIVLLVALLGCAIDMLDPKRARLAAVAAAAGIALSLSLTLEDLPFIGVMVGALGVIWIARGAQFATSLMWFGGALCASLAAAFAATVPPSLFNDRVCDAYSLAHFAPGVAGSLGFIVLGALSARLSTVWSRGIACALAGASAFAVLKLTAPNCIGNPYGAVDPLVNSVWLAHVSEAQPLGSLLRSDPAKGLPVLIPIALGAVCALIAAFRQSGDARLRWALVSAFVWTGLLGSFWEVIVGTYGSVFSGLGVAWVFEMLLGRPGQRKLGPAFASALLAVATTPVSSALATMKWTKPASDQEACFEADAFKPFRALAPGVVLTPIDAGPYALVYTNVSVVDGPYHRDNRGDRLAIESFTSPPEIARQKIREAGAAYVALCPAADEAKLYVRLAPDGLAAQLARNDAPSWLERIPTGDSPFLIYKVD